MLRYTVLRLLIFFGFFYLFWLLGLRENIVLLLGASVVASAIASYLLLRGIRDEITAKMMERYEERSARRAEARAELSDEAEEDRELDQRGPSS